MNKKFSTLAATLLVACGMSSSAFAADKTFGVGTYVTLKNSSELLIVGENAVRDSLALVTESETLHDLNKTLWKVSVEPVKNADGLIKGYDVYLENKVNGAISLTKVDASATNSAYYAPGAVVAAGKFKIANAEYNATKKEVTITGGTISFGVAKVYNAAAKTVDGFKLVKSGNVIKLAKGSIDASTVQTEAGLESLNPEYHSDFSSNDLAFTVTDADASKTLSYGWINGVGNDAFHLAFNKDITDNAKFPNPLSASDLSASAYALYGSASYDFGDENDGYVKEYNAAVKLLKDIDEVKKNAASYVKEVKVALGEEGTGAGKISVKAPNATDLNTVSTAFVGTMFANSGDLATAITALKGANDYAYTNVNGKFVVEGAAAKIAATDKSLGAINKALDALKADTKAAIDKYDAAIKAYASVAYRLSTMEEVDFKDFQIDGKDADDVLTALAANYEDPSAAALTTLAGKTPALTASPELTADVDDNYYPYAVVGTKDTYVAVDTNYVASREKYLALTTTKLNKIAVDGDGKPVADEDRVTYILVPELGKVATSALFKMEVAVNKVGTDAITIYANAPKPLNETATAKYFKDYKDGVEEGPASADKFFDEGLKVVIRTLGSSREASVQTNDQELEVVKNTVISFTQPVLASKIKDGAVYFVINKNVANENAYDKYQVIDPVNQTAISAKHAYANVPSTQWLAKKNNDIYTFENRDFDNQFKVNEKIFVVDEANMTYTTNNRDTFQLVEVDAVKKGHLGYKFISEEIQKISTYAISAVNYANTEIPYYLSFDGGKDSVLIATSDATKALSFIPMMSKDGKEVTSAYKMNDENLSKQYYQLISKSGKDTLYLAYNNGDMKVTKVPNANLLQFRNINDAVNEFEVLIGSYDKNSDTYVAEKKLSYNQSGQAVAVGTSEATAFVFDLKDTATDIYKNFGFEGVTNVIISLNGDAASKVTKVNRFAAVKRTGLDLRAVAKDEDFALSMDTAFVGHKDNIRYAYYVTKPINTGKNAWNDEKFYMVTYTDSLAKSNDTIKYSQDGLTRVGFVAAKRLNADSLAISKIAPAAADTLNVTEKAGISNATFAFAIDEDNEEAYRIESSKGQYLSYLNGILVMGAKEQAQLFNVNKTELNPVKNENISANGVSVDGGNGVVVVKGATGKTVAISTILGKSVANQVLTSDSETIAVPAGMIAVTIEGETFKVLVK